jgi:NADPH:quinone reductase-like Zn-dependent oxidoreductase
MLIALIIAGVIILILVMALMGGVIEERERERKLAKPRKPKVVLGGDTHGVIVMQGERVTRIDGDKDIVLGRRRRNASWARRRER